MESAAQSLVGNVGQLLGEEYRLLRGVSGDVAELRDELETMNALLVMQSEAEDGAVDHFVRVWMKQVRELAYDAEDCVDQYVLRVKTRSHGDVRAWLKHMCETLLQRHCLAGDIAALRARAVAIGERHARYGINCEALRRAPFLLPASHHTSVSPPALPPAPTSGANAPADLADGGDGRFVGIAGQAETLAARLSEKDDMNRVVFSLVGFGGLGKTTLAVEVCRRLKDKFQRQAMVSVSQAFQPSRDLEPLLKRLLEQVVVKAKTDSDKESNPVAGMDGLSDRQLTQKLEECLKDERYLIVIDDVWSARVWGEIKSKLPENKQGSRIIVTTRMESVARACCPAGSEEYICHVQPLKEEYARKLFISRAFGNTSCPKDLEDIMSKILRKCSGLPLAIVSIASVLAGYRSSETIEKWETIYRSIGYQMESNPTLEGMRQIVTLSYDYLPHELKGCMMYLSIFPEDYLINKDRLLYRWIAEGLIPKKRGTTMLKVAESYLEELVSRNMIEEDHFDGKKNGDPFWLPEDILSVGMDLGNREQFYRVHDMLLEVMVSKSLEVNFVSFQGGQYDGLSYDRIRRLSIHPDMVYEAEADCSIPRVVKSSGRRRRGVEEMNLQHVRSLSMFQQLEGHELLALLGKFSLLRMLDLEGCVGVTNDHVRYACQLRLLRFLSLRDTLISIVPSQVKNLEHLETLDVRDTELEGLPDTVTKMEKLERLLFSNRKDGEAAWALPRGLSKMKALREVGLAILRDDVLVAQELGELPQLQELTIDVRSDELKDKKQVLTELAKSLSKAYSLRRLNIRDGPFASKRAQEAHKNGWTIMNFLHGLSEPPLLRYLRISGGMSGIPTWVGSLTYLVQFNICHATIDDADEMFRALCMLPSLKSIWIEHNTFKADNLVASKQHKFPVLSHMAFLSGASTPKVIRFEEGSMEKLETLLINFWGFGQRSIEGIEYLTSLKGVVLFGGKSNKALSNALEYLKKENESRSNKFDIGAKYYACSSY